MKGFVGIALIMLMFVGIAAAQAPSAPPPLNEVVKKLQEVYSRQCCFKAAFDQVTVNVAMDLKDRFQGMMYVKRPGLIALDVESPEKQQVVIRGRSYGVFFPREGNAVRGEVPPEMNVEQFFGFLSNVTELDRNFSIAYATKSFDPAENLLFLELTDRDKPTETYRIVVGIDMQRYVIRRAIIYDALGNYNRFELHRIVFLPSLPDSVFEIAPGRIGGKGSFLAPLREGEQ